MSQGVSAQTWPPADTIPARALELSNWKGAAFSNKELHLHLPGQIVYTVPSGGKKWFNRGLTREYDGTIDARQWFGIRLKIFLDRDIPLSFKSVIMLPEQPDRHDLPDSTIAVCTIAGKGWHSLVVPFSSFDYPRGQQALLKYLRQIRFQASFLNAQNNAIIRISDIELIRGNPLALTAPLCGKAGAPGETIHYIAQISNSADHRVFCNLRFLRSGWEGMQASVDNPYFSMAAGEIKRLNIGVRIPLKTVSGAQESQVLQAMVNGSVSAELKLTTSTNLTGPFLVLTTEGWAKVAENIKKYDWAKAAFEDICKKADDFSVPMIPAGGFPAENSNAVLRSASERQLRPLGYAWQLTHEKKYADKIVLLLKRFSAPDAYPATLHASSQGIPQEGGMMEGLAVLYDLIRQENLLTSAEKASIEEAFRIYIRTVEDRMGDGGISNWSVFNLVPAAECALVLQDMQHFDYLMNGSCGIRDQFRLGVMSDGWWNEVSLSYNIACAEAFTKLGLATAPFGIDFLHEHFPVSITGRIGLKPYEFEKFEGMSFEKYGPILKNEISVKDMWDAIKIYPDYRGVMFGMGDGHEEKVGGSPFELAYYAFRDTSYAAILKQSCSAGRDLIYGIPDLSSGSPGLFTVSGHSDNAGIAVLRSRTDGRPAREQLQAAVKYGTHGGYHGHFDRASLLSLMRYGRSFWNPEASWYGYASYMYKWWVQTSMASNMVVVDDKMQEPVETVPLLFYSGKMMQAMAVETSARWSNPPYFGGYKQLQAVKAGDIPFVPLPEIHPVVGAVTEFTEPVKQRRLLIVTDDYVVMADSLSGIQPHIFDNLLHLKGLKVPQMPWLAHLDQFDPKPVGSGQFITNVNRYQRKPDVRIQSALKADNKGTWQGGGFNGLQEPGALHIDVYPVWPEIAEVFTGTYPEALPVSKKLNYVVLGDNKILADHMINTWALGRDSGNINIDGVRKLTLRTKTERGNSLPTLFWGNAVIVDAGGKTIPLSQLPVLRKNVMLPETAGHDYQGGEVVLSGRQFSDVLAAEPEDDKNAAELTFDLSGLGAVQLRFFIGGDFPVGPDDQVRKTLAVRSRGRAASFLTILEPYEDTARIKKVSAIGDHMLSVELKDGRVQEITLSEPTRDHGKIMIKITETLNGKIIRQEETGTSP
ncbi:hypothetical protein [Mucilaginibacter sp. SJ]|uniref:hypothetical protein n=1 Tax=Mucilaginibacter sp. SJ TaxID=3029053 RepID=UPI0023A93FA6|nr:hypothetical protein [Mucilaginibacter sp. SJ]WEA00612.1 hypothetical protein MusilaSJ_24465 [Mucilaginibacter sp. SJ]